MERGRERESNSLPVKVMTELARITREIYEGLRYNYINTQTQISWSCIFKWSL